MMLSEGQVWDRLRPTGRKKGHFKILQVTPRQVTAVDLGNNRRLVFDPKNFEKHPARYQFVKKEQHENQS